MKNFVRIWNWIAKHLEELLLVILLSGMSLCMILQIFMRHVMKNSLSWSEELIRYAFIYLVFLGFGLAVKEGRHISITFLKDHMSPKIQWIMDIFADIVFLAYSGIMLYFGAGVVRDFIATAQTSPALGIPKWIVFMAAPIGFALVILRLVKHLASAIRKGPKHTAKDDEEDIV